MVDARLGQKRHAPSRIPRQALAVGRAVNGSLVSGILATIVPTLTGTAPSMIFKIIVILILLMILASLGSGLVFLIRDGGRRSPRTVKALTVRIVLSIGLFVLLMLAYATGLISPHGL